MVGINLIKFIIIIDMHDTLFVVIFQRISQTPRVQII